MNGRNAKINITLGPNIFTADGDFDFNQVLLQMFKDWLISQRATVDEAAVAVLAGQMGRDTNQLEGAVAAAERVVATENEGPAPPSP